MKRVNQQTQQSEFNIKADGRQKSEKMVTDLITHAVKKEKSLTQAGRVKQVSDFYEQLKGVGIKENGKLTQALKEDPRLFGRQDGLFSQMAALRASNQLIGKSAEFGRKKALFGRGM